MGKSLAVLCFATGLAVTLALCTSIETYLFDARDRTLWGGGSALPLIMAGIALASVVASLGFAAGLAFFSVAPKRPAACLAGTLLAVVLFAATRVVEVFPTTVGALDWLLYAILIGGPFFLARASFIQTQAEET